MIPLNALGSSTYAPATRLATFPGLWVLSSNSTGPGEPGGELSSAPRDLAAKWQSGLTWSCHFSTKWEKVADIDSEYFALGEGVFMAARGDFLKAGSSKAIRPEMFRAMQAGRQATTEATNGGWFFFLLFSCFDTLARSANFRRSGVFLWSAGEANSSAASTVNSPLLQLLSYKSVFSTGR